MPTPETKVKRCVASSLNSPEYIPVYLVYPSTGGYGNSGAPDMLVCYRGYFVGIECKAGKNKPTKLQLHNLEQIRKSGGIALVINEENMHDVIGLIEEEISRKSA